MPLPERNLQFNSNEPHEVAQRGWLITLTCAGVLLALGVLYAWSVFKANIPVEWGWTESQKTLPYSVACVVLSTMAPLGARLLLRYGPRIVVSVGGVMAGLGVIISSFSSSPLIFTLAFGVLLGSGIGFVYASASPTALSWFPASRSGLVTGIVVAGFGLGSIWVAPLARSLIESVGLQATMLYLGITMLIAVVGFAQMLKFPPAGFVPREDKPAAAVVLNAKADYPLRETVRTWQFYFLWITFAFGAGAGLMVIGNLAIIVKEQIGLPALSAIAVSALSLGNSSGRVLYGVLSDKIGRRNVLMIAFLGQAVLVSSLYFMGTDSPLASIPILIVFVALIGANYGANLAVFPAMVKDYYGPKHFAMNFSVVNTAWGLGGFMVSQLAGLIKDVYGSFNLAYLLAAGMLVAAAVFMFLLKSPQSSEKVSNILIAKLARKTQQSK
jgi:MFS transporter, OFA family, oxalate/formate antiporter